jgi:hypothetical protein
MCVSAFLARSVLDDCNRGKDKNCDASKKVGLKTSMENWFDNFGARHILRSATEFDMRSLKVTTQHAARSTQHAARK